MKKSILILSLFLGLSVVAFSCKDNTKQNDSNTEIVENTENHYKCPMDCEKGKTYDEEGQCPVCKMDLKEVKEE